MCRGINRVPVHKTHRVEVIHMTMIFNRQETGHWILVLGSELWGFDYEFIKI